MRSLIRRLKFVRSSVNTCVQCWRPCTAMSTEKQKPEGFTEVAEGKAKILFENKNSVFYNNVQEFNRDITIAVMTEFAKEHLKKKGIEAVEFSKDQKNIVHLQSEPDAQSDTEPSVEGVTRVYPGEKCEEGITILEALSATGLRSVRLAKELPGVKSIVANDISKSAVEAIRRNIEYNDVGDLVTANEDDASIYMYNHKVGRQEMFDVIDVDPYGTAAPFLDAAVQAVKPQGLLCVTCTDMAVLAGNNAPETCWAKYHSMPLKTKACHEQALRILLGSIEQHANRYSRYIEPLISVSVDFYIRVFVKVHFGQAKVKLSASKQAYVIRCASCTSYHMQPVGVIHKTEKGVKHTAGVGPPVGSKCEMCGHKNFIGGPIWAASMHNNEFLQRVFTSVTEFPNRLKTSERIKGLLAMMSEELEDVPLFYVTDELSSVLKCDVPQEAVLRSAILNAGYRVSSFHGRKSSIKTDAPPNIIWDIMKAWFEKCQINKSKFKEGSAPLALVERESTSEKIDFTLREDANPSSKRKGMLRFPVMPENWGPKARARQTSDGETEPSDYLSERRKKFQGKRKSQTAVDSEKKQKIENA